MSFAACLQASTARFDSDGFAFFGINGFARRVMHVWKHMWRIYRYGDALG
jgi:hypothetical protein